MTNHEHILKDLSISQSTADSIAGRLGLPTQAVQLLLSQLEAKGQVESSPLGLSLVIYRLTSGTTNLKPPKPCSPSNKREKS